MDLDTITTSDFKSQFSRDFPYLRVWSSVKFYSTGNEISRNSKIYMCMMDNKDKDPESETDYWSEIEEYESNYITDSDIARSFSESQMIFNQGLFGTSAQIQIGYLYLTAHYLVMDIRAAQKGIQGNGEFAVASRSAGSVSESYSVPEWVTKDRVLSYFTKTAYGLKYLSFILGRIVGNVQAVEGATLA